MKSIITLISFFLFAFSLAFAQDEMPVEVIQRETSMGIQSGFMITIKNAELKTVIKDWEKEIKDSKFTDILKKADTKVQLKHIGDEYIADNAIIQTISSMPLTVIATISDIQGGIRFIGFIKQDSTFISKENTKEETFLAAQNYIRSFGIESLKKIIEEDLDQAQDELKSLEKDLNKLMDDKNNFEEKIVNDSADIRDTRNQISVNLVEQGKQLKIVEMAKDTLYTFNKKSDEYKIFKNKLKDEQRTMKKLVKTNKSYHSKVRKYELDIDKNKNNINNNLNEQWAQKESINKQKQVVFNIEEHLKRIK